MEQVISILLKYAVGVMGVGFVVLLHELGHFIAAHMFKIEVEIFSVGFGPKMFAKKIGYTEYRISWFLFGGYCRMKGSDDLTRALDSNSKAFIHVENGSLFSVKPIYKLLTYGAGPLTNFLITIFLCTALLATNHQTLSSPSIVSPVDNYPTLFNATTSSATESGIQINDKIIKLNNIEIKDWQEFVFFLNENSESSISLLIERENKELNINVEGTLKKNGSYKFGLTNIIEPNISTVRFLSPENKAGLKKGDLILKVNDYKINNNLDILTYFNKENPKTIDLTILRDEKTKTISYTPSYNRDGSIKHNFSLYSPTKTIDGLNFTSALESGYSMATTLFSNTITSLINIVRGQDDDVRQVLTGPVRASLMIGNITILGLENSLASGFRAFCYLLAVVSISLTIANLLPLPAFDGGQMVIAFFEIITRTRISPKHYWICQLIGMVSVLIIFSFMYFIDIRYFFNF
jgi:regulator of sigma E protease